MILDVEQSLKTFYENNMSIIVGNGNFEIDIYTGNFPDSVSSFGLLIKMDTPAISEHNGKFSGIVRIQTRAEDKRDAFGIFINHDDLMDRSAVQILDDSVELCTCLRVTGPEHFIGAADDNLHYYTGLYSMQFRKYS